MSISLSRYSPGSVLSAYVRAIEALPNLHTLQVIHTHCKITTALKDSFAGRVFPKVQTVALPGHAHDILRSCPEVRKIICVGYGASKLIGTIANVCKKVEEVEGFCGSEVDMKGMVLYLFLS
jgi:ABC-type arginine transport system permease subunit